MGEEDSDITITYETLYELLRNEKDRTELQKLDKEFFKNLINYLNEKKNIGSKQDDLFSFEERKEAEKQIENAKRILREFYDRREKKIINLALDKSRTNSGIIDTSVLLEEEKKLYNLLINVLEKGRKGILLNIINNKLPSIEEETLAQEKKEEPEIKQPEQQEQQEKSIKMLRFLHAVPKFIGKELEQYGPFEAEDMANLPKDIANLLIEKGRAEEIKD